MLILENNNHIIAGFTEIPDDIESFSKNYSNLSIFHNVKHCFRIVQVHGNIILNTEDINKNTIADGMYTNNSNKLLITSHADCIPVYFYSSNIVMLIHAGRVGIFKNIIENALDILKKY